MTLIPLEMEHVSNCQLINFKQIECIKHKYFSVIHMIPHFTYIYVRVYVNLIEFPFDVVEQKTGKSRLR